MRLWILAGLLAIGFAMSGASSSLAAPAAGIPGIDGHQRNSMTIQLVRPGRRPGRVRPQLYRCPQACRYRCNRNKSGIRICVRTCGYDCRF